MILYIGLSFHGRCLQELGVFLFLKRAVGRSGKKGARSFKRVSTLRALKPNTLRKVRRCTTPRELSVASAFILVPKEEGSHIPPANIATTLMTTV